MASLSIEARVGVFVLAALGLLVGFVLALGDFSWSKGFRLYADFGYAGGLQTGAPVKLSGVRVGHVSALSILDKDDQPPAASAQTDLGRQSRPLLRARLELEPEYRRLASEGVMLHVGTQGVIGEAYVELEPGPLDATPLVEGSAVRGVDAPRLHVMALQLSALLDTLGSLVGAGPEVEQPGAMGEAVGSLVRLITSIVNERRGELSAALGDLAAMAKDLRQVTAELRQAVQGGKLTRLMDDGGALANALRTDVPGLLGNAKTTLASVEALSRKANQAVDEQEIEKMVKDVRTAVDNVQKLTDQALRVMDAIRRGQGTVGGLVTDPQIYDDLKEMLRDLKRHPWKFLWRD